MSAYSSQALTFKQGVHPNDNKDITADCAIRRLPFPAEVVLPLSQHIGAPATPLVAVGDYVERGDIVAQAQGAVSVPMHASVAGTVVAIERQPHPNGSFQQAIRIKTDHAAVQMLRGTKVPDWHTLTPEQLAEAMRDAGIVGLGGAAFPMAVKLHPPKDHHIHTLLINGCECEPYLTSDHRVMVERADMVLLGARIQLKSLGITKAVIGVERNKPAAIEALEKAISERAEDEIDISVQPLQVKYPQGAEKMLIAAVSGAEVESGKLPSSLGFVVQNVSTVAQAGIAFDSGMPLLERVVTVSGRGIKKPGNWIVPIGTRLEHLIDACGGLLPEAQEVIFGGPMMGFAQADLQVPLLKATGGILVLAASECKTQDTHPCIKCGRCIDACPMRLNPQMLGALSRKERYEEMDAEHIQDCMLCGCCSFVCPSNLPLSQLISVAKTQMQKIKVYEKAKAAAKDEAEAADAEAASAADAAKSGEASA